MGLTIHYNLKFTGKSDPHSIVEKMRQFALDLPFESVSDVIDFQGYDCDFNNPKYSGKDLEGLRWKLIQAAQYVECPWNKGHSKSIAPERIIAFTAYPGWGAESLNIGLCTYPKLVDWEYEVKQDVKFHKPPEDGQWTSEFSWEKWDKFVSKLEDAALDKMFHRLHGFDVFDGTYYVPFNVHPSGYNETRQVKTKLKGFSWSSFCKTQYASSPDCGGVANFVKCHVSAITLLEKIATLPGVNVHINDEGQYGPSNYSDDYKEAHEQGRDPIYKDHEGQYNVKKLIEEIGEWNGMIAAFAGGLNDLLKETGAKIVAPITEFNNFEYLEFKGQQNSDNLSNFLKVMDSVAKQSRSSKVRD